MRDALRKSTTVYYPSCPESDHAAGNVTANAVRGLVAIGDEETLRSLAAAESREIAGEYYQWYSDTWAEEALAPNAAREAKSALDWMKTSQAKIWKSKR